MKNALFESQWHSCVSLCIVLMILYPYVLHTMVSTFLFVFYRAKLSLFALLGPMERFFVKNRTKIVYFEVGRSLLDFFIACYVRIPANAVNFSNRIDLTEDLMKSGSSGSSVLCTCILTQCAILILQFFNSKNSTFLIPFHPRSAC